MGADIHGWVEARSRWVEDEELWSPLVNAGALLDRNYLAFARLFGVRNYSNIPALAAQRGFPQFLSSVVQEDTELYAEYCHSATWATWEELKTVDWTLFNESFQLLRQLMELLSQSPNFNQIRLVVWFDS